MKLFDTLKDRWLERDFHPEDREKLPWLAGGLAVVVSWWLWRRRK